MDPRKLTILGGLMLIGAGLIAYLAIGSEQRGTSLQEAAQATRQAPPEISEAGLPIERVKIGTREFRLEVAATPTSRYKGLSGRTEIADDGGMLFVFPRRQVRVHEFVMRDCLVPIDIIFLDPRERITAMYEMEVEPPRREDEPQTANPAQDRYFARLKRYSSVFPSQFVIELKGGTLKKLKEDPEVAKLLRRGQKIDINTLKLVRMAR